MKKELVLVVIALVAVLVAAGSLARAAAGPEPNDPQDTLPAWSSDGAEIAFTRSGGGVPPRVAVMTAGGKSLHFMESGRSRGFVPGTHELLVQFGPQQTELANDDGNPRASYAGSDASPSPDGQRIAYLRGTTLYAAAIDGTGERALATGVAPPASDVEGPVWSPDGARIVIASGSSLLLVSADGSGSRPLATGTDPTWSPDGSLVAYDHGDDIWLVDADGSDAHRAIANGRLPAFSPVGETLAFVSNRKEVLPEYRLYTQAIGSTAARMVADDVDPSSPPRWSSTGAAIAVAGRQECRRDGILVNDRRRSNLCRFDGTARADRITGTPYFDIISGAGGDDHLNGRGGNDDILGENGNDVISGGAGNDTIFGGPGNDVISGGAGNDSIIPGNGRDVIDCGPGNDTVQGAGPLDRIAKDCEHIRR